MMATNFMSTEIASNYICVWRPIEHKNTRHRSCCSWLKKTTRSLSPHDHFKQMITLPDSRLEVAFQLKSSFGSPLNECKAVWNLQRTSTKTGGFSGQETFSKSLAGANGTSLVTTWQVHMTYFRALAYVGYVNLDVQS